jgi:hypothetical protein
LLVFNLNNSAYDLEITDVLGKTVWQSINNFNKRYAIDISAYPKGVYYVKVLQGNTVVVKKIIYM